MRLALVIGSIGGGGAERVMATLANGWAERGVVVRLITLGHRQAREFPVDPRVERVALELAGQSKSLAQAILNNWHRMRALRAAIRASAPDVVISFLDTTNILTVLATVGLGIPVVVSDRSFVDAAPPRGAWRVLYRFAYRRAAAVVAQTAVAAAATARRIGRTVYEIPNPLRAQSTAGSAQEGYSKVDWPDGSRKTLLAMGRLHVEKGFDLLIDAFSRVLDNHPDWQLVIVGEGPLRAELERTVARYGLQEFVNLPGFTDRPENALRTANLFVLSSRFEGFPNVLLEAMAEGKACISFDCPTGPAELIDHSVNGWLVAAEDVDELANGLDMLMSDPGLREQLGARARDVAYKYSLQAVLARWDAVLASLLVGGSVVGARATGKLDAAAPSRVNVIRQTPKVLFLIRSLNPGGAERQLVALASGLARRGLPVAVACFYGGGRFQFDLERAGVPVIDLEKQRRWDVVGFLWRLLRAYRKFEPDVVHGYMPVANMLALLARIGRRGVCVVWGVRASNVDFRQYDWLSAVSFRVSGWLSRWADCIVCNSHAGATYHVGHGYPEARIRVVPNGIDTDRFCFDGSGRKRVRSEWGVADGHVLVGLVGRLDPMKDHRTFLRAAALLAKDDPRWRFVCVGRGPWEYVASLQELSSDLGLGNCVVWAGARDDLAAVYSAIDVAASSSYGEGFPNAIGEALACGVPCVVTDVGDSARVAGEWGIVVPARQPAALADGLTKMWQRGAEESVADREARRRWIQENFSVDALLDRTESVLRGLDHVPGVPYSAGAPE